MMIWLHCTRFKQLYLQKVLKTSQPGFSKGSNSTVIASEREKVDCEVLAQTKHSVVLV